MFRSTWLRDLFLDPPAGIDGNRAAAKPDSGFGARRILIAYATQTGAAESIAEATREQLEMASFEVELTDFHDLDAAVLEKADQTLFITSTTFDGDPPDMAETFRDEAMRQPASLSRLRYGLLALGDRAYDEFCGFGRRLDAWLRASGAQPCFERIDVDDEDEQAIARWHACIDALLAAHVAHASPPPKP